jgi:hypothetical protein
MDVSNSPQNRRQRRSQVLMAAALEFGGASLPVRLRNLSAEGALVEGEDLPVEGASVVFRRQELCVAAKVVWMRDGRAGLCFDERLSPEIVLRHVPTPRPRVLPEFRRPGLSSRVLTEQERWQAAQWVWRPGHDLAGE